MHRIELAEEQPVMRHAVRMLLEQEGYEVVLEAADGVDALQGALKLKPDLLITALRLRRMGGLEVLRRLHDQRPKTKVLVLTEHDSEHVLKLIMQAGASGFVSKHEDLAELRFALQALARDHSYFPSRPLASLNRPAAQPVEVEQLRGLSPRELTVLYYLANGYNNKAIASELSLNDRTVSTHKARLFRKLNVKNMIELAAVARRHDFLGPGPRHETTPTPPWMAGGQGYAAICSVLNAIPSSVMINDLEGRLLFVNDFVMERYVRDSRSPAGQRIRDTKGLPPTTTLEFEQVFLEAARDGRSFTHDAVLQTDGSTQTRHFWGAPILDGERRPVAMVCLAKDFSDHEQMVERLRDAKEQAEAANRAKTALLGRIADQLRGPVEVLGGMFAALEDDCNLSPVSLTKIDQALEVTSRLQTMLDNLGVLAEMNNVSAQVAPEACYVAKLTAEICAAQQKRLHTSDPAIRVDVDSAGSTAVWLDRQRYRQLLAELLAQAVAHARHEYLDVRLNAASKPAALVFLQLEIRESGTITRPKHGTARPRDGGQHSVATELARSLGAELKFRQGTSGVDLQVTLSLPRASV